MKNIDLEKLGERIRHYRHASGMLQRELADAVGVAEKRICFIENGMKAPSLELTARIAGVLGVTLNDLVNWGD